MASIADTHHHRSTTKVSHKHFKSRHASKGFLKDLSKGKIDGEKGKRNQKPLHQQAMSKIDRRHQARQKQQLKHQAHVRSTNVFSGQNGAPRIVAVVPLTEGADPTLAVENFNKSLGLEVVAPVDGRKTIRVDRFKQSLEYLTVRRDLLSALDACRVADFVVLVLSSSQEVDEETGSLLRAIESQGISNVVTVVQGLDSVEPVKNRPQVIASWRSYISRFLPDQEKVHSLDSRQECLNVVRSLCTTTPKGIRWREDRSWMLVDDVQWPAESSIDATAKGSAVLTGIVRGKGLKANRLLQLGDLGTFQIEKITRASLPNPRKRKAEEMAMDEAKETEVLELPDSDQDDLAELAPEEAVMTDDIEDLPISEAVSEKKGVLLDDHHYFSDDETHLPPAPKRLPKGTSAYQAAWYLGDVSDSASDLDDEMDQDGDLAMETAARPEDGLEGLDQATQRDPTEFAGTEYPQSEMFLDPSPNDEAEELAAYRLRRKNEAEEDLEFPDEIELHPHVLARERLARYRGLKSLRTSIWETVEDKAYEPAEWSRLLQVAHYKGSKSQVMGEALIGGVQAGTRVHIHLRGVPRCLEKTTSPSRTLAAFSLLRHEHKRMVVNYTIALGSDYPKPIKSKEELVMQCGPRRFVINPLISHAGNTPNNVHKFDRYLHPGQTEMATFIAPLTWGSVPTLFFKRSPPSPVANDDSMVYAPSTSVSCLRFIGTGTSQPPDQSRIIAKRVILTGHPYKIHKKLVTIRYMFFNKEDINWFKALQLWTKRGRSGYIKESLGTHGYFKATFDAKINPQDSVGVSLYKRVFPRSARAWREAAEEVEQVGAMA